MVAGWDGGAVKTLDITILDGIRAAIISAQRLTAAEGQRLSEMVRSRSTAARGNIGTTAVSNALTRQAPRARAAIPYSAIVSALMQPQTQRVR